MHLPCPFWGLDSIPPGKKCLKNESPTISSAILTSGGQIRLRSQRSLTPSVPSQYPHSSLSSLAGKWNFVLILECHLCWHGAPGVLDGNGKSMSFGSHRPFPILHTHMHPPPDHLQNNADEVPQLRQVLWPAEVLLSLRTDSLGI